MIPGGARPAVSRRGVKGRSVRRMGPRSRCAVRAVWSLVSCESLQPGCGAGIYGTWKHPAAIPQYGRLRRCGRVVVQGPCGLFPARNPIDRYPGQHHSPVRWCRCRGHQGPEGVGGTREHVRGTGCREDMLSWDAGAGSGMRHRVRSPIPAVSLRQPIQGAFPCS